MPYRLKAFIGSFDQLRTHTDKWRVAPLRQRMGLIPVTEALFEELTGAPPVPGFAVSSGQPFAMTSPALEQVLGEWSRSGPIGYVEASFHGGSGYQTGALWRAGDRVWGPVHTWDFDGPRQDWPINAVLSRLGVALVDSTEARGTDLFSAVGLSRLSDTADWKWAALCAERAADYDQWHQEQLAEDERVARAAEAAEKSRRLPGVPVILDGNAVMELLDIPPGPLVGAAIRQLQNLHIERGPLSRAEAVAQLRAWVAEQDLGRRND